MQPNEKENFMDFIYEQNRIYLNNIDGQMIAEVTFPETAPGIVDINHTYVDTSLRGQGVAGKLMLVLAEKIKADGIKARCSCSYAVTWFEKHPEFQDQLQTK